MIIDEFKNVPKSSTKFKYNLLMTKKGHLPNS